MAESSYGAPVEGARSERKGEAEFEDSARDREAKRSQVRATQEREIDRAKASHQRAYTEIVASVDAEDDPSHNHQH